MQAIHAPLVAPTAITHATWIPEFLDGAGGLVVAGGGRVRVYDETLRRVYDQSWGGEVRGLEGVRLVGGRAGLVVGFGGKVSRRGEQWEERRASVRNKGWKCLRGDEGRAEKGWTVRECRRNEVEKRNSSNSEARTDGARKP